MLPGLAVQFGELLTPVADRLGGLAGGLCLLRSPGAIECLRELEPGDIVVRMASHRAIERVGRLRRAAVLEEDRALEHAAAEVVGRPVEHGVDEPACRVDAAERHEALGPQHVGRGGPRGRARRAGAFLRGGGRACGLWRGAGDRPGLGHHASTDPVERGQRVGVPEHLRLTGCQFEKHLVAARLVGRPPQRLLVEADRLVVAFVVVVDEPQQPVRPGVERREPGRLAEVMDRGID